MNLQIVISVGNSDDRLPQKEWCRFIAEMEVTLATFTKQIHLSAGSAANTAWQNWGWIAEIGDNDTTTLLEEIKSVRQKYKQDSAFVLIGEGQFV